MEMQNNNIFPLNFFILFFINFHFILKINASSNLQFLDKPSCLNITYNENNYDTSGTFNSPNYPHEYPENADCTYIIEVIKHFI